MNDGIDDSYGGDTEDVAGGMRSVADQDGATDRKRRRARNDGADEESFLCPLVADRVCALMLCAVVVTVVIFAAVYGKDGLDEITTYFKAIGSFAVVIVKDEATTDVMSAMAYLAAFAFVPAVMWGSLMLYFSGMMIRTGTVLTILLLGAACGDISRWMYEEDMSRSLFILPALGGCILSFLIFTFLCAVQERIDYGKTCVSVCTQAIRDIPSLLAVGGIISAVGAGWIYAWIIATVGVVELFDWTTFEAFLIVLIFTTSLLWSLSVCVNILRVTVACSISRWWGIDGSLGSFGAFARASTVYVGSIALGSFFVRMLESVKFFLRLLYHLFGGHPEDLKSANVLVACCSPITACLSRSILYISSKMKNMNHYAYVFLGINVLEQKKIEDESTMTFAQASKRAWKKLDSRDKEDIVSDLLIYFILAIGKLWCGAITGLAGLYSTEWSWSHDIDDVKLIMGLGGFILGYFVASIFLSIIDSGVSTIYVLWVLYPEKLRACKEEKAKKQACYDALQSAFSNNQKDFMEQQASLLSKEA